MLDWNDVMRRAVRGGPNPPHRVERTAAQWREQLTPEAFRVTREHGTERAFSSAMCVRFEPGVYACVCCDTVLFDSGTKFDSGTGWPSFTQPIDDAVVAYNHDQSHGMSRVEALCAVCDAHLGHVFPDGPRESTGLRYCINAIALTKRAASSDGGE